MTDFDDRVATDNWAQVDFDPDVWVPMPLTFQGTKWADAAEWAWEYAGDRVMRTGTDLTKKVVKKEVLPFAGGLVRQREALVGKVAAHKIYLHCPNADLDPIPASVGLWKPMGTREEAYQYYAYWGSRSATTQPVVQEYRTEMLGQGLIARWSGVVKRDHYDTVNYVFRDEEFHTDVHVYAIVWSDPDRYASMLPDIEKLVHSIRCIPTTMAK